MDSAVVRDGSPKDLPDDPPTVGYRRPKPPLRGSNLMRPPPSATEPACEQYIKQLEDHRKAIIERQTELKKSINLKRKAVEELEKELVKKRATITLEDDTVTALQTNLELTEEGIAGAKAVKKAIEAIPPSRLDL